MSRLVVKCLVILICFLTNFYSVYEVHSCTAFLYPKLAVTSSVTEEVNLISSLSKENET